jgi:GNAT superfamily N-acetyltransferase
MSTPTFEWQKAVNGQEYIISTKHEWLSHEFINESFAREEIYWTTSMPAKSLETMLANSCTLGLYIMSQPEKGQSSMPTRTQIGFGRLITDHITFVFLTDVFILPEYQGNGLGKWLIACTREVMFGMPELRRAILLTSSGADGAAKFYEKELDMNVFQAGDEGKFVMMVTGKKLKSGDC